MQILSGLFDHMVLQRDPATNRSDSPVRGTTTTTTAQSGAEIFVRVNGKAWMRVARASSHGEFQFRLAGLRKGGPHVIELEAREGKKRVDALTVKDVLVGDVWLAAGQSNMQGIGLLKYAEKPQPLVRAFYPDDRWAVARDPIHQLSLAVDSIHHAFGEHDRRTTIGTGPAVAFAVEMHRLSAGVPQGIIACAHGGTNMDQWDPALRDQGGASLYGAMVRRLRKNGDRVAGMIWYQGESDTLDEAKARAYTEKMKQFVRAIRRDARSPGLPIAAVQISKTSCADYPCWNDVQEQQRLLPRIIRRLAVVPAIDLRLDDTIHIGGTDNNRLGRRLARAMMRLTGPDRRGRAIKPPIELRRVRIQPDPVHPFANLIVEFDNVEGKLIAPGGGRATGFAIHPADPPTWSIYDVELRGNQVILRLPHNMAEIQGKSLHYGPGHNPFCNITDESDRSLPAFGPVRLGDSA